MDKTTGITLLNISPRLGIRFQIKVAHWREPYWFYTDLSKRKRITFFGFHYSINPAKTVSMLSLIIGPILIRLGWV